MLELQGPQRLGDKKRLSGSDFPEMLWEIVKVIETGFLNDESQSRLGESAERVEADGQDEAGVGTAGRGVDAPVVEEALETLMMSPVPALAAAEKKKVQKADRDDPALKGRLSSFLEGRFPVGLDHRVIGEDLSRFKVISIDSLCCLITRGGEGVMANWLIGALVGLVLSVATGISYFWYINQISAKVKSAKAELHYEEELKREIEAKRKEVRMGS